MEYLFVDALDELIRAERYDISVLMNRKVYSEAEFPILTLYTALYNHQVVIEMLFRNGYPNIHDTADIPNDGKLQAQGLRLASAEGSLASTQWTLEPDLAQTCRLASKHPNLKFPSRKLTLSLTKDPRQPVAPPHTAHQSRCPSILTDYKSLLATTLPSRTMKRNIPTRISFSSTEHTCALRFVNTKGKIVARQRKPVIEMPSGQHLQFCMDTYVCLFPVSSSISR